MWLRYVVERKGNSLVHSLERSRHRLNLPVNLCQGLLREAGGQKSQPVPAWPGCEKSRLGHAGTGWGRFAVETGHVCVVH